jgi:hypothetical protein
VTFIYLLDDPSFFVKVHTEETKGKNRAAHLGKKLSDTAKEKCRQAAKKYWESKREKNNQEK